MARRGQVRAAHRGSLERRSDHYRSRKEAEYKNPARKCRVREGRDRVPQGAGSVSSLTGLTSSTNLTRTYVRGFHIPPLRGSGVSDSRFDCRREAGPHELRPGLFYSAIFATCTGNPVFGNNDVNSNTLKPFPVISVWRYTPGSVSAVSWRPCRSSRNF